MTLCINRQQEVDNVPKCNLPGTKRENFIRITNINTQDDNNKQISKRTLRKFQVYFKLGQMQLGGVPITLDKGMP